MKKVFIVIACSLFMSHFAMAQAPALKLGYVNSSELLAAMPEIRKADTALSKYAKSYQEELESMGKEYQSKLQQYQGGEKTMSDAVKEVKQKELLDLQNRIEGLQQSAQEKIQAKKEEMYKPITERVTKAINSVAKENGFSYIFDASGGSFIYANEGDNIIALVKSKLGIK